MYLYISMHAKVGIYIFYIALYEQHFINCIKKVLNGRIIFKMFFPHSLCNTRRTFIVIHLCIHFRSCVNQNQTRCAFLSCIYIPMLFGKFNLWKSFYKNKVKHKKKTLQCIRQSAVAYVTFCDLQVMLITSKSNKKLN